MKSHYHDLIKQPQRKQKTYLLDQVIEARINQAAAAHQVGQSDLVRHLLTFALDALEADELEIVAQPPALMIVERILRRP